MRFSDFLLVSDPGDLDFIVGYTEDENIRISVSDFFGNQIYGSGNPGYIPVFTGTETLGNSQIFQDGSNIVIGGVNAMGYRLAVGGSLYAANGAVIESSMLGSNTFRAIGEEGNSFIIPHDLDESIFTPRTIIHAPAVLTTQSATLGQVNTAISNLEADIDILLDLKVDKTSVGAANGVASLDSGGKVPLSQIPDSIIGQVQYMGTWNAFTNTPTLNPLVPEERGHYYVVSAAGVFGGVDYQIGDWIISNGLIWEKVDNTDAVTSVFGRIGGILALEGDYQAFYPRLSQTYDNPTWINTLAFTKITGVPAFLLENQTITLSGDVTGSGKTSIASTISNNAVSNEKLRDSVGTSVIGRSASTTGDPADIQATTDGHVLLRSAGNLLFGLISGDSISSIDWSKITGTPTTLSGYGITNAYTKTESDNKFVPYTGASANVNLGSNNITANSFIKAGGTSSQFLKADGSVDTSQYIPTTRSVNAGTGLTGGGNLSSDITIAFDTTWGDNRYAYRTRQLTINGTTYDLSADRTWTVGTVTSIGIIAPLTGGTITSSGIIGITQSGSISDGYLSSTDWNTFNNKQGSLTLTTTGTSGASTLIGNTLNIPQYTDQFVGTVTSVGLSMPLAFNVSNSPITSSGTITVTGAGTASQYVRGDGTLADFPSGGGGGGSSVSYYLNGSVNQGTFVGNTYYEMSKTPIFGAGTDFVAIADGYVAQFITDAGDPNSLIIPAGNWNFETYFSASSAGGTPSFYVELYKYDGSTFTLIASNSTNPELIAFGTTVNPYFSALAVPETILTVTDRIAIRIYVVTSGRTITLHTENSNLCQIVTTFTRGLTALNGLTAQVQYFQVGTSGTDFNIASSVATHTFNLPTASAVNRGALSSADWSTFNSKQNTITLTTTGTSGPATFIGDVLNVPNYTTDLSGYVTLATNQTITGLKTILRSGDVLNFKIGTDTLYGLKVAYNQNELAPSGEATWSFVNTFNNGSGTGLDTTPISFFRGVLVTGQRLVSASVNTNLLDYYGNNPSGRYPIYAYNTGVQQFASSIIVGETTGVVNAITGAISDLPAGVVANFKGRVIGSNAVNSNEFVTLSQISGFGTGTVTSVGLTSVTSGVTIGSTPITTSGNITMAISTATASQNGLLSSTDWTTFNSKQGAITLTTTGTSGASTLVGNTLNIPNYTDSFVGTVTSVSFTLGATGTNLSASVANSTTTPVITLNVPTASASARGALSSTDWTTFNSKQNAITLTTTGTSGAATLVGATLNIPSYTDSFVGTVTSVAATAGTGISVSGSPITTSGTLTITNTAPDQVVALTASTGIAISGTYPNFTITNTSPSSGGTVTSVTASSPLFSSGGTTPNLTIQQASGSQNGFLSSTDWTTFNNKAPSVAGGYLPLSGGTLTGALNGTSAVFSSTVSATQYTATSTGGSGLRVYGGSGTNQWDIYLNSTNLRFSDNTGTGNIVFDRPLNGTSAVFSGGVKGNGIEITNTANADILDIFQSPSALNSFIDYPSGRSLILRNKANGFGLTLASTGAATFSNSVTARSYGINNAGFRGGLYAYVDVTGSGSDNSPTIFAEGGLNQGNIYFCPNGSATRAMTINTSSNVLIGTTTDSGVKFDVLGTARISGNGTYAEFGLKDNTASGSSWFLLSGFPALGDFTIREAGVANHLVIKKTTGNVGIGTATPTNGKLEIQQSTTTAALWVQTGGTTSGYVIADFRTGTNLSALQILGNGASFFGSSTVIQSGNSLFVNNTSNTRSGFLRTSGQGTELSSFAGAGEPLILIAPDITATMRFYTGGSTVANERMRITSGGNVLIGTTTDNGNRLRVNGVGFFDTGVRTGQPYGTTSDVWKLGRALVAGSTTIDRWIRVQIGGEYYDLLSNYGGVVPT